MRIPVVTAGHYKDKKSIRQYCNSWGEMVINCSLISPQLGHWGNREFFGK